MGDLNVEVDGLDEAIASTNALGANIEFDYSELVDEQVEEFVEAIKRWIGKKGLISHDGEGVPLVESFYVQRMGDDTWVVLSSAEHAMPLEEGTQRHRIEPEDAELLAWEPENPGDYTSLENIDGTPPPPEAWYDPDAGMVFSTGVTHPGNRAYEYIMTAQSNWQAQLGFKLEREADKVIVKSGFSRV